MPASSRVNLCAAGDEGQCESIPAVLLVDIIFLALDLLTLLLLLRSRADPAA